MLSNGISEFSQFTLNIYRTNCPTPKSNQLTDRMIMHSTRLRPYSMNHHLPFYPRTMIRPSHHCTFRPHRNLPHPSMAFSRFSVSKINFSDFCIWAESPSSSSRAST